jgi:hypothetical protein
MVKDFVSRPDDELLKMLADQCEKLPADLQTACKMAVTLVGKQMITYIRTHLRESPRQICTRFRLCKATEQEEENRVQCVLKCLGSGWNVQKVLALLAKCRTNKQCYIKEVGQQAAECIQKCFSEESESSDEQDTPLCGPCQLGVQLVKDFASKPDDELLKMLVDQCEKLPENIATACKMAVTLVGKQMITYIRSHLRESPRQICGRFRLCKPTEEAEENRVQCVLKCLGSGWNVQRVLALLAKCRANKACYIKEVGQQAAECVMKCF